MLTDEQRARIEESKRKALALRAAREEEARRAQSSTKSVLDAEGGFTQVGTEGGGDPAEMEAPQSAATGCAGKTEATTSSSTVAAATNGTGKGGDVCECCHSSASAIDPVFRTTFGVVVCAHCKADHDDYTLMSKGEAVAEFLLQEGTIRVLPFLERQNPRNSKFQSMKLYLKKQVREKSYARWGGPDELEEEHEIRKKRKYDTALKRVSTSDVFSRKQAR